MGGWVEIAVSIDLKVTSFLLGDAAGGQALTFPTG